MDYGNLLSRAWQITLRHKILWLFGILATLGSGGGFNIGGGGRSDGDALPPEFQRQLQRPEVAAIILAVGCVALVIALALFVLSIIGRGGLIGGVRIAEERGAVTFGDAWSVGTRYFWRLLGIVLLLVVPVFAFGLLSAVIALFTLGFGLICIVPLACLLAIAYIPLGIVAHFAQYAVVLDDLGVMDAFRKSWNLLQANLGPIIMIGVILLIIGIIAGLILVAPFFAIVLPTIFFTIVGRAEPNVPVLAAAGLALLCYLPVAILLSGVLHTWTTAVWTLAYRQFTGNVTATVTPPPVPA